MFPQTRKLKNRVAAQTSRDRKKAKMDEMDLSIQRLSDENDQLQLHIDRLTQENGQLQKRNMQLEQDNDELREHLEKASALIDAANTADQLSFVKCETSSTTSSSTSSTSASSVSEHWMGCGINPNGSAVSDYPLPKVSECVCVCVWPATNGPQIRHVYEQLFSARSVGKLNHFSVEIRSQLSSQNPFAIERFMASKDLPGKINTFPEKPSKILIENPWIFAGKKPTTTVCVCVCGASLIFHGKSLIFMGSLFILAQP